MNTDRARDLKMRGAVEGGTVREGGRGASQPGWGRECWLGAGVPWMRDLVCKILEVICKNADLGGVRRCDMIEEGIWDFRAVGGASGCGV
jgi:hypothetical protein